MFDWSNVQNGKLIGSIGIVSALIQGAYVRRSMSKVGEGKMARHGVMSCVMALVMLALLPKYVHASPSLAIKLLQIAAVCMAFTSATVVNALTALASLQCDDGRLDEATGKIIQDHPALAKGKALGKFRSSGQLGRALGPLLGQSHTSQFTCYLFVLNRIHSLCVVLDFRAIHYVCNFRNCHVCIVHGYGVDNECIIRDYSPSEACRSQNTSR